MDALIIIGEPGAGKTTLTEYLTAGIAYEESDSPVPFRRYDCGVVEIGKRREGGFSGTDALAMNIQPKVLAFLEGMRPKMLLFEGDRLANGAMFKALADYGYTLHLYQLWGARVAAAQREARGSKQDPTWLKGRQTKVTGLRQKFGGIVLPAGAPLEELLMRMNDPVSVTLIGAKVMVEEAAL